jgi:hypothetical protein
MWHAMLITFAASRFTLSARLSPRVFRLVKPAASKLSLRPPEGRTNQSLLLQLQNKTAFRQNKFRSTTVEPPCFLHHFDIAFSKQLFNQPKSLLMNSIPNRIVIYTKDVSNMTGLSGKAARKLLRQIRQQNGKPRGSFVTIEEFCLFTRIKEETIKPFLT